MRSSNKRSRSKPNRNRPSGNIVNRVFDSSGPEGKVRGTPQQIIDKYNQLARDAQLSNDRVAAENFQQHAEHYLRMLSEAQREMDAKREQQEQQHRERQQQQSRRDQQNATDQPQPATNEPRQHQPAPDEPRQQQPDPDESRQQHQPAPDEPRQQQPDPDAPRRQRRATPERHAGADDAQPAEARKQAGSDAADVIDVGSAADDGGLVETPESKPAPRRRSRRKPKDAESGEGKPTDGGDRPEAAE